MTRGRDWNQQWTPGQHAARPLRFGTKDHPGVVELQGAFRPPPVPPDFQPPPPPGSLQRVLVEQPTDGWWRQAGAFGFRYQGAVPPNAGDVIPLTEQLNLPGPPRIWTVHWFRYSRDIATEASPDYGTWDLRGRITYGVGGASNVIECDVMTGMQLALVCNSIKVDMVAYNPFEPFAPNAYDPGDMGVVAGAMFGDYSSGGALAPTWSTPIYRCGGDGSLNVDIVVPDFARSLVLHTNVFRAADLVNTMLFFNTPGISQKAINALDAFSVLNQEGGIALPAQCNQIRLAVTANAATIASYFSLQFFLAL
jgi:hypothetical protein